MTRTIVTHHRTLHWKSDARRKSSIKKSFNSEWRERRQRGSEETRWTNSRTECDDSLYCDRLTAGSQLVMCSLCRQRGLGHVFIFIHPVTSWTPAWFGCKCQGQLTAPWSHREASLWQVLTVSSHSPWQQVQTCWYSLFMNCGFILHLFQIIVRAFRSLELVNNKRITF